MTVKNQEEEAQKENVIDDIEAPKLDTDKLAQLKAKMDKGNNMPPRILEEKTRSIRLGCLGSGQAGSRIAEALAQLGYPAIVFNTAIQDLKHIKLPEENKYLLQYGLGGAAKELEIGKEAAEAHKDAINELVALKLADAQVLLFCTSLGGGSGAGSVETMIDVLSATGKPIVVITVLPMSNEDAQTKSNALETLAKLSKEVQNNKIHNLIVVDNAKIETIYSDVSQMDFFDVSNKAIVEIIDIFNKYSAIPSSSKPIDGAEWAKILLSASGLSVYGELTVPNYEEDTAIAEAVINSLSSGLLASGFDLKQSKYVGILILANKSVWDKIPSSSIGYCVSLVGEMCGSPQGIFKGMYSTEEIKDDVVKIYSFFSGLGLPDSRIQQLKKDAQELMAKSKVKDIERNLTLKLDTGVDDTTSAADKIRNKIAQKKSAFGGLMNSAIQDRRKK